MSFTLTTDRLILQVENSRKAGEVLSFYLKNRKLFEQFEPTRPDSFYTLDYQTVSMDYEYSASVKGKSLRYYIYLKEQPGQIIGSVNFSQIMHGPFPEPPSVMSDADYHGYGYAFEACRSAITVIFCDYKIHRLDARVALNNTPSIKLLERLGFRFEGIEYQGVEVNGMFTDHYRYGLISTIQ